MVHTLISYLHCNQDGIIQSKWDLVQNVQNHLAVVHDYDTSVKGGNKYGNNLPLVGWSEDCGGGNGNSNNLGRIGFFQFVIVVHEDVFGHRDCVRTHCAAETLMDHMTYVLDSVLNKRQSNFIITVPSIPI